MGYPTVDQQVRPGRLMEALAEIRSPHPSL